MDIADFVIGKSSTINSVLDISELAREGALAEGCTCVATEYSASLDGQQRRFAARIQYFPMEQIHKILQEHIRNYGYYHFDPQRNWTAEIKDQMRLQANTAVKVLGSLFQHREGFQTEDEIEKSLCTNHSANGDLLDQLTQWCDELLQSKGEDEYSRFDYFEVGTVADFRRTIEPLISSVPLADSIIGQVELWPLVEKVK